MLSVAVDSGLRHGDRDCGGSHVVVTIALELADAGAFHLAATGGWDAAAETWI
ncbi:MAG: hypothetical protein U9N46_09735 [Euryarchaeota archaeon]|nr:hypothetical protein [Euryarchaeota archaeon]